MKDTTLLPAATIVAIALLTQPFSTLADSTRSIAEFDANEDGKFSWDITDDGVMGGLSRGQAEFTNTGTMVFKGTLSLENNGGFSTVRTGGVNLDLSDSEGLALRVKGDGRSYQLRLATRARYRSREVSFSADFDTEKGKWVEVRVPFDQFKAGWRGRSLSEIEFDPSQVRRLGILIGDKKAGPFRLEVDWLRTYGSSGGDTIAEIVVRDGRFKTLAAALSKAGLVDTLAGEGPFTVFAPTDNAFAKLPENVVGDLLKEENRSKLTAVLTYHVVAGESGLAESLRKRSIATLQGDPVRVSFSEGQVRVNDASITTADISASNGVIHIIESVLIPSEPEPKSLLQTARAAGSFNTLLAAVEAAGLTEVLESEGPFTIFAPTDTAFSALPAGTVETLLRSENRDQLQSILKYHAVAGRVGAGNALTAGSVITLDGRAITFAIKDGVFQVNDAIIRSADIEGGNGLIHVIDSVLLPPTRSNSDSESGGTADKVRTVKVGPREQITAAIHLGVPLFNNGDAEACAEVYESCIRALAAGAEVGQTLKMELDRSLRKGEAAKNAVERAWIYRHALDATLTYVESRRSL